MLSLGHLAAEARRQVQFVEFCERGPPMSVRVFTLRFRKQEDVLPTLIMSKVKHTPSLNFQLCQRSDATGKMTNRDLKDISRESSYKNLICF